MAKKPRSFRKEHVNGKNGKIHGVTAGSVSLWKRYGYGMAFAALAVALVLFYFDYLIGRSFLWEDLLRWYYPAVNYFCTSVAEGRFPFWLSGIMCGVPLYTDLQTGVYYPFVWLMTPFAGAERLSFVVYQWYMVLHLVMGGGFMCLFLRRHQVGPLACFLGAAVYCFGGFSSLHIIHFPMLQVYAWLPLQMWLVDLAVVSRRAIYYALLTGAVLLSFFAGFPQTLLYQCYLLAAYWLWRRYRVMSEDEPRTAVALVRALGMESLRMAGVFVSALLLGAVLLLPSWEHWRLSVRENWGFDEVARQSMPWRYLLHFVVPNFFGVTNDRSIGVPFWGYNPDALEISTVCPGYWQYWEFGGYAGQLALMALVVVLFQRQRFRDTPALFFAASWLLALWFMLGRFGGLFNLLYHILPGVSLFRGPSRMACVADFCAAMLVAFLVRSLAKEDAPDLGKPLFGLSLVYLLGVVGLFMAGEQLFPELQDASRAIFAERQTMISVAVFAGTALCLWGLWRCWGGVWGVLSGVALALLTCMDFFHAFVIFHRGGTNPEVYYADAYSIVRTYRDCVQQYGPMRFSQRMDGRYAEFLMDSNMPLMHKDMESTRGYLTFELDQMATLNKLTNDNALLDLKNVGFLIRFDSSQKQASWITRPQCLPRVKFFTAIARYPSDEAILRDLESGVLNYHDVVAVRDADLGSDLPRQLNRLDLNPVSPRLTRLNPETYVIEYTAHAPGILFVSESYYPGWEAVDEKRHPLRIIPVFTAFKGIIIPQAGSGTLTVRFRPSSFFWGRTISFSAAVLLGAVYVILIRRENRCRGVSPSNRIVSQRESFSQYERVGVS